jgi:hypothetical protein
MNRNHQFLGRVKKAGAFLACCFTTATLIRLMMLNFDAVFTVKFGFAALVGGCVLAWFVLRRWRFAAPLRCAAELGICGGIGGWGLYVLCVQAIAYLFTPQQGSLTFWP